MQVCCKFLHFRTSSEQHIGVGFDPHRPYQIPADSAVLPNLNSSNSGHQRLVLRPSCAQIRGRLLLRLSLFGLLLLLCSAPLRAQCNLPLLHVGRCAVSVTGDWAYLQATSGTTTGNGGWEVQDGACGGSLSTSCSLKIGQRAFAYWQGDAYGTGYIGAASATPSEGRRRSWWTGNAQSCAWKQAFY